MKQEWRIPIIPEREASKPPTIWIPVIAFIVFLIGGTFLALADWKQGQSIASQKFVESAVIKPLLLWLALCGAYYVPYENWRERVQWWNFLCANAFSEWRHWSQSAVAIIDSVMLTPETELAERMAGLEGKAPTNPGKTMVLHEGTPVDPERLERIYEKLIAPHVAQFNKLSTKVHARIVLEAENDSELLALQAALKKRDVRYDAKGLSRVHPSEAMTLLQSWFEPGPERPLKVCLLIACQLHTDGNEPACSEAAVSLLLASPAVVEEQQLKLLARLFRPITSEPESASPALQSLMTAQPTPLHKIRHMWFTHLPKLARNNVLGALDDTELQLVRHDLDQALGKPGAANVWLVQALAAHMAAYGQGPQLVATPDKAGVMLNLVGMHYAKVPAASEPEFVGILPSYTALIVGVLGFVLCIVPALSVAWFLGSLVIFILLLLIGQPFVLVMMRGAVNEEFNQALWKVKGN